MSQREYCPTCQHVIAKNRGNISSLEIRRLIHNINTFEGIIDNKDRLYRFVRSQYRVKDYANQFLKDLEDKLDSGNESGDEDEETLVDNIKLWLLGFVNGQHLDFPPGEIFLYEFLYSEFNPINEPFSWFYDAYLESTDNPMSKNRVSRALSAFGLKPVMKKIMVEGKMKCTIMLCATEEELAELQQKNGFNPTWQ